MKLALVLLAACSDAPTPPPNVGGCNGMVITESPAPALHVPEGTQIDWSNNPPTSGMHYPVWAAWNREYAQLPRGYYVHNAEHGGVVFLYRCDAGCPDVVAQLEQVARDVKVDSSCDPAIKRRVILTGDPLLPDGIQVAAITWAHAYTAECFDPYVGTFARLHYGQAPEDLCADGVNLGGTPLD